MKKILVGLTALLLVANVAKAQTIESDLTGLGVQPEVASYLASVIPLGSTFDNAAWFKARNAADSADINVLRVDSTDDTILNADTGDTVDLAIAGVTHFTLSGTNLIYSPAADANRLFTFAASSDTAHSLTFGDAGVTAAQTLLISGSNSDADDDSTINITAGGDFNASGTRGGYVQLKGNEASGAGDVTIAAGAASGSDITLLPWASDGRTILGANGANRWTVTTTGLLENDGTNGGNLNLTKAGTTIAIEEATAGSACSGTLTANGATPVVTSTTCAVTGARIFLSRTSAETGVVTAWVSAISNGVSFSVTGEAGDTGTYNWFIIHEAS